MRKEDYKWRPRFTRYYRQPWSWVNRIERAIHHFYHPGCHLSSRNGYLFEGMNVSQWFFRLSSLFIIWMKKPNETGKCMTNSLQCLAHQHINVTEIVKISIDRYWTGSFILRLVPIIARGMEIVLCYQFVFHRSWRPLTTSNSWFSVYHHCRRHQSLQIVSWRKQMVLDRNPCHPPRFGGVITYLFLRKFIDQFCYFTSLCRFIGALLSLIKVENKRNCLYYYREKQKAAVNVLHPIWFSFKSRPSSTFFLISNKSPATVCVSCFV